jgi:3-hydroxyisobutyrate dehydrogenase-like beta-hydroxyacid dehydrogenase
MAKQTIGFIGLGDMGGPMAARLLEHGYRVLSCVHRKREDHGEAQIEGHRRKA